MPVSTINFTGTTGVLTADTAKTASTTAVDFTGIPSWVKRITIVFLGVSTNGTNGILVRIGDSGGIVSTSYQGGVSAIVNTTASQASNTTGFFIGGALASNQIIGNVVLTNPTGNSWVGSWVTYMNDTQVNQGAGSRTLSGALTQVRITTVGSPATDTFDAGTINILYE